MYQVLTSALSVLEVQFEGAEREAKKSRTAGRLPGTPPIENMSMPQATITLTEMVCIYT